MSDEGETAQLILTSIDNIILLLASESSSKEQLKTTQSAIYITVTIDAVFIKKNLLLFLLNNTNNFQPFEKSSILHIPTAISEHILPLAYTNAHSRYSADIQSKKHCKPVTCQALFWCGNLSLSKTDDISASWRFVLSGDETNHTANKKMLNHSMSDADKAH